MKGESENERHVALAPTSEQQLNMHTRRSQRRFNTAPWVRVYKRPAGTCNHPYGVSLMMIRFYAIVENALTLGAAR
jgi:hypothetical protein